MLRSAWSTVRMQSEIRPAENAITLGILRSDFGFPVLSLVPITFQSHAQGMWQKGHRCEERAAIFLQLLALQAQSDITSLPKPCIVPDARC